MTLFTPLASFMIVGFVVLAVVAAAVSLAVLSEFVVSNRKVRLARRESFGSYYRGLALTH